MRSGELNRTIIIQRLVTPPTQDAAGQPVESWIKVHADDSLAAHVVPNRGGERFTAQQIVGKAVVVFKVRWRSDVDTKCRILYDGKTWDVLDVRPLGQREALEIDATARSDG